MLVDQLYAIVDIEATGGSIGADERIIQIACVLMKNNEIVDSFDSLVNPEKYIPKPIQKLTNIRNKDVQKAPYFEEIAPIIQRLLDGAIFVAHNVGFDYRFLNEQFKLHGFKEMTNAAIDTVELSQILFPTMDSFQLEEIAGKLDYDLKDAHDALADAKATSYIFKKLFEKATSLPLITLEKLVDLAECTTHETALFFIAALKEAQKNPSDLAEGIVIVNQIAMQDPFQRLEEQAIYSENSYPKTSEEKRAYLKEGHHFRAVQADMMDIVYDYFQSEKSLNKCAIEAPPGIGKSLGYLLPASFLAKEKAPIVISTYTTLLQDQLVEESIPELEEMLGRKIRTVLVKSSQHYLSLSVFERWLKEIQAKDSEAYLAMRLLVWLTSTTTGDLSEINAGSHLDLKFWQDIRAKKNQYADEHWKDYDFYERIKKATKDAEFIITNHHFIVHDWKSDYPLLKQLEHLIIDEAHHFPDIAAEATTIDLKVKEIFAELDKMGSISNNLGLFKFLNDLYDMNKIKINDLKVLNRTLHQLKENWEFISQSLMTKIRQKKNFARSDSNFVEAEFKVDLLTIKEKRIIKNIVHSLEEFLYVSQDISIRTHTIFKDLGNENQLYLIEFVNLIHYLKNWKDQVEKVFNKKQKALRWVSYLPGEMENTFQFHLLTWGEKNSFIDYLATQSKVVFCSSSLSYQDSEEYFSNQLKNLPLDYHQLASPFDYSEQVRMMLPNQAIHPKKIKPYEYAGLLADSVREIIKDTKVNSIVLFRSLSLLEEVYYLLSKDAELKNHLILAQGISGTRNRILKQFKRHRPAIILGADSFFEGIDLPDEELEVIILTRLPFPAPNAPLTRLKTNLLKAESENPFLAEYLPRAVLKFRQAFGRLIRKKTDRGVMVILDERFLSANYADAFKEALAKGVKIEQMDVQKIGHELQEFVDEGKEKKEN